MKEINEVHSNQMQKEIIIERLKEKGCRITQQRKILLDIILEEDCSCSKEIYFKASRLDSNIGTATVYRMINMLEEIGAIDRRNMFRVDCGKDCRIKDSCLITLDDDSEIKLTALEWKNVVMQGLKACGYANQGAVKNITINSCD